MRFECILMIIHHTSDLTQMDDNEVTTAIRVTLNTIKSTRTHTNTFRHEQSLCLTQYLKMFIFFVNTTSS